MSDIAIRAEGLGKEYRIGQQERYQALRDRLAEGLARPFNFLRGARNGHKARTEPNRLWALKDVSFEIRRGEAVGVIGRNGAGKSTLLKILSRIVDPTKGRAEIHGRVGSLLEVGTGFHPELTGRENVYLSGSIIGMKKAEIDRRFDEIVAFAEVEKFIDTMVKYYSSGMYLRLAFAVAAHLEPEVLLVDEVLAVGDAAFQRKCLQLMSRVTRGGLTVLLVSHNAAAIEALCKRSLLLTRGALECIGSSSEVLSNYIRDCDHPSRSETYLRDRQRPQNMIASIRLARLRATDGQPAAQIRMGDGLEIEVEFESPYRRVRPNLGVAIKTAQGAPLFGINSLIAGNLASMPAVEAGTVRCRFDTVPLMPGRYLVNLYLGTEYSDFDSIEDAMAFDVLPAQVFPGGHLPPANAGPVYCPASFTLRQVTC